MFICVLDVCLKVGAFNANSVKRCEGLQAVRQFIIDGKYDIFVICESKGFNPDCTDSDLPIEQYYPTIRADRNLPHRTTGKHGPGGGILICVRRTNHDGQPITFGQQQVPTEEFGDNFQYVCTKIEEPLKFNLIAVYNPSSGKPAGVMDCMRNYQGVDSVVIGDFNIPWKKLPPTFEKFYHESRFKQLINEVTNYHGGQPSSCIDHIYTNMNNVDNARVIYREECAVLNLRLSEKNYHLPITCDIR